MRVSLGASVVATLLLMSGAPASAHSFLVDATPSSKDHVESSPKTVKLRFGGGVEAAYSTISVENANGGLVAQGVLGDVAKPRELSINVPAPLTPGRYVVKYRVLSTDGHIVEGNYEFFVDGQ